MTQLTAIPWSVHLGTADCTCVRFTGEPASLDDPWPLSRVVTELVLTGASMGQRPRALGSGRGIPLVHSQILAWRGTTLELEAHTLRDGGSDEVSITLPAWDELAAGITVEDDVWEVIDIVAAAIVPSFGIIGDGEAIGATRCETGKDLRALLPRHIGVLVPGYTSALEDEGVTPYRELPRSGMIVIIH